MSTSSPIAAWYTDSELFDWLFGVTVKHPKWPGRFLFAIASAAKHASADEFEAMRPLLIELKRRHPEFRRPPVMPSSS